MQSLTYRCPNVNADLNDVFQLSSPEENQRLLTASLFRGPFRRRFGSRIGRQGLVAVAAQVEHDADRALGFARLADIAAVQDQPVMRTELILRRRDGFETLLDLERRLAGRQTGAVAEAEDMRIDRDRRLAERDVEHGTGGLAPDPRQPFERLALARHLAAVLVEQYPRQLDDIDRLRAVQPDRADEFL